MKLIKNQIINIKREAKFRLVVVPKKILLSGPLVKASIATSSFSTDKVYLGSYVPAAVYFSTASLRPTFQDMLTELPTTSMVWILSEIRTAKEHNPEDNRSNDKILESVHLEKGQDC